MTTTLERPYRLFRATKSLKANTLTVEELKKLFTLCDRCKERPAIGLFGERYTEAHCIECAHPVYRETHERMVNTLGDGAFMPAGVCY